MGIFRSFPLAFKLIFRDPINVSLMLIPACIALAIYVLAIGLIVSQAAWISVSLTDYLPTPEASDWLGKLIALVLIIFVFFLMNWTFIILVGLIAAPFNSTLSARIEKKLIGERVSTDRKQTFRELGRSIGFTVSNELKKLVFIGAVSLLAFLFYLVPLFYPIGMILIACLLAAQFIDYSWSRHDVPFGACLRDLLTNIIPYAVGGFFFLFVVAVPIINAFVPALATAYFTVLWLHRQNLITQTP